MASILEQVRKIQGKEAPKQVVQGISVTKPCYVFDKGLIHFTLDGCDAMKHAAINRTCQIFTIPSQLHCVGHTDPWERAEAITEACENANFPLVLNSSTICGNDLEGPFSQKSLSVLYEDVCLDRWPSFVPAQCFSYDFTLGVWTIDCKCKHREASPRCKDAVVTVPPSQRGQQTDFYCFGQMAKGMNEGWIISVMSKKYFQAKKEFVDSSVVDSNGISYPNGIDRIFVKDAPRWHENVVDYFFPMRYMDCIGRKPGQGKQTKNL